VNTGKIISSAGPADSTAADFPDSQSDTARRHNTIRLCRIFEPVSFPECVLSGPVSTRLRNCLFRFKGGYGSECSSLATFLERIDELIGCLVLEGNFGKKSQEELLAVLERIVSKLLVKAEIPQIVATRLSAGLTDLRGGCIEFSLTDKQWNSLEEFGAHSLQNATLAVLEDNFDDVVKEIMREPETGLRNFLKSLLDERDYDVLNRRYGGGRTENETLEEIAEGYGVTRERIRQIEVKALRRCRIPSDQWAFRKFLETQQNGILSAISCGGLLVSLDDVAGWKNAVTGLQRLAIDVLYDDFESWLDTILDVVRRDGQRAGWFVPNIEPAKRQKIEHWIRENTAGTARLRHRITDFVRRSRWPVTISSLHENMPDMSDQRLVNCLRDELEAEVKNGVVTSITHLPSSTRLILVLRDAGRPLHTSEVRARHNKMFGFDISEHAASSLLQRLEEALIVERGTYGLYENLSLKSEEIQTVRDASISILRETGFFLSAKILRRYLVPDLPPDVNLGLTTYMLLGICQDDERFSIRRGLMIGLAQEGFEETFTSLNDMIHDVVREHGPISNADIREHISHQRDVLSVSVHMVLQNSPEIVMSERGLYNVVEQVIGDDSQIEHLSNAIQIALIDQPTSLPVLMSRLGSVGFVYSSATILSFLRNTDIKLLAGQTFQLTAPDLLVLEYNQNFYKIFDLTKDQSLNRLALTDALRNLDCEKLIPIDFRLVMNSTAWNSAKSISDEDIDFLDEMMSEFEF
jgi:hypothetical protein